MNSNMVRIVAADEIDLAVVKRFSQYTCFEDNRFSSMDTIAEYEQANDGTYAPIYPFDWEDIEDYEDNSLEQKVAMIATVLREAFPHEDEILIYICF